MVTVIAKENELPASVHNGANNHEKERYFPFIKDYREVNFHRSQSCKPLPADLTQLIRNSTKHSSIEGLFFVQIDEIESPVQPTNNRQNRNNYTSNRTFLILKITDGMTSVDSIAQPDIPKLWSNVEVGCKLLIQGVVKVEDGYLQLTRENTSFQFGSSRFSRPRSMNYGRTDGSYRRLSDGRRDDENYVQTKHENANGGNEALKSGPLKSTLMDFMSPKIIENLKIDSDGIDDKTGNHFTIKTKTKLDDRSKNRTDSMRKTSYVSTTDPTPTEMVRSNSKADFYYNQFSANDQMDHDDRLSHSSYRERKNQLPPRLQRAQEERSRRSATRNYDETDSHVDTENDGDYDKEPYSDYTMSSPSGYVHFSCQRGFIPNIPQVVVPHPNTHNSYAIYSSVLPSLTNAVPTPMTYAGGSYTRQPYCVNDIPVNSIPMQPGAIASTYPYEYLGVWCQGTQPNMTYLSVSAQPYEAPDETTVTPEKIAPYVVENDKTINYELQADETNDSENRSQSSLNEPKTMMYSSSSSLNDAKTPFQKPISHQFNDKNRNPISHNRHIWKVNDVCWAKWSGDNQFYAATIVEIHSSFCTIQYHDYFGFDTVHFRDLKLPPQEMLYQSSSTPMAGISSRLNPLSGVYTPSHEEYDAASCDVDHPMPEVPPFPFNSTGTLLMNQSNAQAPVHSNHDQANFQTYNQQNGNNVNNSDQDCNATNYDFSSSVEDTTKPIDKEMPTNSKDNNPQIGQSIKATNENKNSNETVRSTATEEIEKQSEQNVQIPNTENNKQQP